MSTAALCVGFWSVFWGFSHFPLLFYGTFAAHNDKKIPARPFQKGAILTQPDFKKIFFCLQCGFCLFPFFFSAFLLFCPPAADRTACVWLGLIRYAACQKNAGCFLAAGLPPPAKTKGGHIARPFPFFIRFCAPEKFKNFSKKG